jgi:hypothetical protein
MRTVVLLTVVALVAAGCGGKHTTSPSNTSSRLVAKPQGRALVVHLKGALAGTAQVRSALAGRETSVALALHGTPFHVVASLETGSCGQPQGLKPFASLGDAHAQNAFTVSKRYSAITGKTLAIVLRSSTHKVLSCGNVPKG